MKSRGGFDGNQKRCKDSGAASRGNNAARRRVFWKILPVERDLLRRGIEVIQSEDAGGECVALRGRRGGSPPFKFCGQKKEEKRKKKKKRGRAQSLHAAPSADPMAAGTMSGDHLGAAAVWSVGARRLLRSHTKRFVVMGSAQIILRIFGRCERQPDGAGQSPSSQIRAPLVADRSAVRLEKRMDDGDAESEAARGRGVADVAQA